MKILKRFCRQMICCNDC